MDAPGLLGLLPLSSAPFSNTTMDARLATLLSILVATYVLSSIYMLCAKYGLGQSVDCPAQSMDPQIAQSIYRLTRPQACHTTTSCFVAWVSESANGRTDASFLGFCPPSD